MDTLLALDPTTETVRAMYEQFPYPAVADPDIRVGSHVRLLLSYGQLRRTTARSAPVPRRRLRAGERDARRRHHATRRAIHRHRHQPRRARQRRGESE